MKTELTEREREVLERMNRGGTRRSIAKELFVSEETVKTHVRHIRRKLGMMHKPADMEMEFGPKLEKEGKL